MTNEEITQIMIQKVLNELTDIKRILQHRNQELILQEKLNDLDAQRSDWEKKAALFVPSQQRLEKGGRTLELGEDYEAIKGYYQSVVKKSGKNKGERLYKDKTIEEIINQYKKYCEWEKSKGENQMTFENTMNTIEEQETEVNEKPMIDNATVNETLTMNFLSKQSGDDAVQNPIERRPGKPITNGRSEKISLYLTKQDYKTIEALRIYDEVDLQELLNEAIQTYFETRSDDIDFLRSQEQARQERKALRTRKL